MRTNKTTAIVIALALLLAATGARPADASHVRANYPAWATTSLNLRSGPSTGHSILRVIPKGDRVSVLSAVSGSHWYQVSHGGTKGYVHGGYLAGAPRYYFPVQPSASASYGACHHDYPASDIFAPVGLRFVAVTSRVVDHVSYRDRWDPAVDDPATRGGIWVGIVGDDGVGYYGSHLSRVADGIAVGARVQAGQLLGLTGKSGNARHTPAHTHFGISPPAAPDDSATRRGTVNPYPHLNRWRAGGLSTPDLTTTGGGVC